nr:ribonuclease E/G [Rickettsiaceae bacterium]
MAKKIVIDATYTEDTRVALINEKNIIESIEYETENKQQIKGNIYLAKIVRIEPSLQAAFIEYRNGKNGFLPFSEIHPDYYHIPAEDKKASENVVAFKAITPPEITSEDMAEQSSIDLVQVTADEESNSDFLENVDQDIFSDNEVDVEESQQEARDRQYKIQDVMKKGQIILVQAQKEERGNKGAAFTSYISLAGKYCVLMPNKGGNNGISRRIASLEERRRLRNIISDLTGQEDSPASVIVRTAGVGRTTYDIKRDYDYLARLWNRIREATIKSVAPAFIHMEEGIIIKTIRDMFDSSVSEILLQGADAYKAAAEFMQNIIPSE